MRHPRHAMAHSAAGGILLRCLFPGDNTRHVSMSKLSFLVAATQRSGSTLLCRALADAGVAGRPEEYFLAGAPEQFPPESNSGRRIVREAARGDGPRRLFRERFRASSRAAPQMRANGIAPLAADPNEAMPVGRSMSSPVAARTITNAARSAGCCRRVPVMFVVMCPGSCATPEDPPGVAGLSWCRFL